MSWNNCKRVKQTDAMKDFLTRGWVGRKDGVLYFRPTRGSGGFALYDTQAAALRFTDCPEAIEVSLELNFHDA